MSECEGITDDELKTTNGCGSSYWLAWIFRIPKFISHNFFCCCAFHDLKFQHNNKIEEKHKADDALYDCMYYSAYRSPIWQKWIKTKIADLTYWALSTKLSDICFLKASNKNSDIYFVKASNKNFEG
jgi:hypothetical protein